MKWTKEEWLKSQLEVYPKARKDILEFIWDFITPTSVKSNDGQEVLASQFAAGYCYYFALILKDAFGGEMMWIKGRSHIIWHDIENDELYDSYGVYQLDISADGSGEPVPLSFLEGDLESFRHRGHDFDVRNEIDKYCNENSVSEAELTKEVCNSFPEEKRVFKEPNTGDLYRLWGKWISGKTQHLDDSCKEALAKGSVAISFSADSVLFDELEKQMDEINLLQSQEWIDSHHSTTKTATANCGMNYYCEPLDKHFRLSITKWTPEHYELLIEFSSLANLERQLDPLVKSCIF